MSPQKEQIVKDLYQWEESCPNLPGHVKGVPKGQGFSIKKILIFLGITIKGIIGLLFAQVLHLFPYLWNKLREGKIIFTGTVDFGLLTIFAKFNDWNNLDEFNEFFKPWTFLTRPSVAQDWKSDIEFGRQRLTGMNPVIIRKCKPEDIDPKNDFPVTIKVQGKDIKDINLKSALKDNRLYIIDFKILNQITNTELEKQLGRYPNSPTCLFYVDDEQQLIPIAIKLQCKPSTDCIDCNKNYKVFTPPPNPNPNPNSSSEAWLEAWLAAKIAVANADAAYQGVISHLLNTHLLIEAFAVSTYRNLSSEHIIYKLLTPHYFNTMAINNMARNIFLSRGGFFDTTGALGYYGSNELLNRGYNGYKNLVSELEFYKQALPINLKERDVFDLPNYYYRDDALLIWEAIKEYVAEILQHHYKNEDISKNKKIQAWKEELIAKDKGNINGLLPPEKNNQLEDIESLIDIVTNVIFTATAQHAAVNFPQYDYAGWIPNNPFALYKSFSDLFTSNTKDSTDITPITKRLPNRLQSLKQIVLVKVLTMTPPYSSKSLLNLDNPFREPSFKHNPSSEDSFEYKEFEKFREKLREIEDKIKYRNQNLSKPYMYLLPSCIPQSIAI